MLTSFYFVLYYKCEVRKMKNKKKVIPNKFHLHIQTKYRVLIQENKKKYNRKKFKKVIDNGNY